MELGPRATPASRSGSQTSLAGSFHWTEWGPWAGRAGPPSPPGLRPGQWDSAGCRAPCSPEPAAPSHLAPGSHKPRSGSERTQPKGGESEAWGARRDPWATLAAPGVTRPSGSSAHVQVVEGVGAGERSPGTQGEASKPLLAAHAPAWPLDPELSHQGLGCSFLPELPPSTHCAKAGVRPGGAGRCSGGQAGPEMLLGPARPQIPIRALEESEAWSPGPPGCAWALPGDSWTGSSHPVPSLHLLNGGHRSPAPQGPVRRVPVSAAQGSAHGTCRTRLGCMSHPPPGEPRPWARGGPGAR